MLVYYIKRKSFLTYELNIAPTRIWGTYKRLIV